MAVWVRSAVLFWGIIAIACCLRAPMDELATAESPDEQPVTARGDASPLRGHSVAKSDGLSEVTGAMECRYLENCLQVSDLIFSGAEPAEDAAFAELARLGVRVVVSVDSIAPNVAAAKRHGLRYVHIPVHYDGVSEHARASICRLLREIRGPYYVHCHHGKHRGPAVAAIAGIADGSLTHSQGIDFLRRAGTSTKYAGLYRDVREFKPPAKDAALPDLVECVTLDSLATDMARIDRYFDELQDEPSPATALMLREAFRESVRKSKQLHGDSQDTLSADMKRADRAAEQLERAVRLGVGHASAMAHMKSLCTECHARHRD